MIAETTDLPTRFVKIVVTDDRGRYLVPDLPKANYRRVGSRLRAGGFAEGQSHTGQDPQPEGGRWRRTRRPQPNTIPALYWFSLLQMPPKSDFPGTGPSGQRYLAEHQEPGRMDSPDRQHRRLHRLSSDGRQGHARDSEEHPRVSPRTRKPRGIAGFRPARRAAG